jgi:hypothetical protein
MKLEAALFCWGRMAADPAQPLAHRPDQRLIPPAWLLLVLWWDFLYRLIGLD